MPLGSGQVLICLTGSVSISEVSIAVALCFSSDNENCVFGRSSASLLTGSSYVDGIWTRSSHVKEL